ncbi:MAG TPA: integrase [Lachnospiraceae bacterium]|nr:integrase [Lachnospiraceae bacterium]
MNWVAPIKDEETLRRYEQELMNLDKKYFIMFRLGVGTGLQVQELLKLVVGDVKGKDILTVYLGTKKVKRSYRFEPDLKAVIEEYTTGKDDSMPLFLGHRNRSISREQAYRAMKAAGQKLGLGSVGAQTMRKTFAWKYYKNTGDIAYLTHLLNHASPSVTFRFIGEKPKVDTIASIMTPEENVRARRNLFEGGSGFNRMEYIKDTMNLLEDELENPGNDDAFYGRVEALLRSIEDLISDFYIDRAE